MLYLCSVKIAIFNNNVMNYYTLYKNSVNCDIIYLENQKITIEPKIYLGLRKGLVTDTERVVELDFSKSNYMDVAQVVIDLLT